MRNNGFGFKSGGCLSSWAFPTREDAEEDLEKFEAPGEEIVPVVIMTEDEAREPYDALEAIQAGIDAVAARVRAATIDEITSWIESRAEKAPDDATRTAFETVAFCIGDMT
jgi:hypothetical protein